MEAVDEYDLLAALDALTLPIKRREQQDITDTGKPTIDGGKIIGTRSVPIEHSPLLEQLEDAIAGATGSGKSKGSVAFERNLLDADALMRFMQIVEVIRQWCRLEGVTYDKTKTVATNLRAWYAASLPHQHDENWERFRESEMVKWARYIESKVDPVRQRDLPGACPICGAETWWKDGAEYQRPLVVFYRPEGASTIQKARAICRACEEVWQGDYGVRSLAYELEVRDQTQHDGDAA